VVKVARRVDVASLIVVAAGANGNLSSTTLRFIENPTI